MSNTKGYQDFFVHRAHAINNIIKTLTDKQTFEQFIGDIYSPAVVAGSGLASTQISTATGLPVAALNLSATPATMMAMMSGSAAVTVGNVGSSKKDSADSSYNF